MIDKKIIKGRLGPLQDHHERHLGRVTYSRNSTSKTKPTITYITSPITGAQIDVMYSVEDFAGSPSAFATITIPLATATMGHNIIHADLDSIGWEISCGALLCKIALAVLGFKPEEIDCFISSAEAEFLELTWHTETASPKARRSAQIRTKTVFDELCETSSRHDVAVSDVYYREANGCPGLLATMKNGDAFRQYAKVEQIAARTMESKKLGQILPIARKHIPHLTTTITGHVRNELLFCADTLKQAGLSSPKSWTADNLKALIESTWKRIGLGDCDASGGVESLSPEVADTLKRYLAGEDCRDFLSPQQMTRHRKAILNATGRRIDIGRKRTRGNAESVGRQMHYDRRWKPKGELRRLALCEETAPAIIEELQRGLAFLMYGEIPDFPSAAERTAWLAKWESFAQQERGCVRERSVPAVEDSPSLEAVGRRYRGIVDAPLSDPVQEDELIWLEDEGEWRVI